MGLSVLLLHCSHALKSCAQKSYTSDLSNVVPGVLQARYMCIVYYSVPKNSTKLSSDIHA